VDEVGDAGRFRLGDNVARTAGIDRGVTGRIVGDDDGGEVENGGDAVAESPAVGGIRDIAEAYVDSGLKVGCIGIARQRQNTDGNPFVEKLSNEDASHCPGAARNKNGIIHHIVDAPLSGTYKYRTVGKDRPSVCKADALFVLFKTLAERPEKNRDAEDEEHPRGDYYLGEVPAENSDQTAEKIAGRPDLIQFLLHVLVDMFRGLAHKTSAVRT